MQWMNDRTFTAIVPFSKQGRPPQSRGILALGLAKICFAAGWERLGRASALSGTIVVGTEMGARIQPTNSMGPLSAHLHLPICPVKYFSTPPHKLLSLASLKKEIFWEPRKKMFFTTVVKVSALNPDSSYLLQTSPCPPHQRYYCQGNWKNLQSISFCSLSVKPKG